MNDTLRQLANDFMLDPDLKARALADPAASLAERGVALPEGHSVSFVRIRKHHPHRAARPGRCGRT